MFSELIHYVALLQHNPVTEDSEGPEKLLRRMNGAVRSYIDSDRYNTDRFLKVMNLLFSVTV